MTLCVIKNITKEISVTVNQDFQEMEVEKTTFSCLGHRSVTCFMSCVECDMLMTQEPELDGSLSESIFHMY